MSTILYLFRGSLPFLSLILGAITAAYQRKLLGGAFVAVFIVYMTAIFACNAFVWRAGPFLTVLHVLLFFGSGLAVSRYLTRS
jgi:hypothetical protein